MNEVGNNEKTKKSVHVYMCVGNYLKRLVIITDLGSLTNEEDDPSNLSVASNM